MSAYNLFRWGFWTCSLVVLAVRPASAQDAGVAAPCARSEVPAGARETCAAVAQAVASAQPQFGLLLAGGNPTLGSVSTAGLRVPGSPGLGTSGRLSIIPIRMPDPLAGETSGSEEGLRDQRTVTIPAFSLTLSLNLFPGVEMAPTIGGIGSVDVLGSASWLPVRSLDYSAFWLETDEFAYGIGARVGVLRESFTLPGASVSVMYRRYSQLGFGRICSGAITQTSSVQEEYRFSTGVCPNAGDPGQFTFGIGNWSGRGVLGKQLGQLGLAAGAGYDRFDSDVGFSFRYPGVSVTPSIGNVAQVSGLDLTSDRWSAFANASFTTVVTTFALEAGWMEGAEPVAGFSQASDFDPRRGTLFGSIGIRLSF